MMALKLDMSEAYDRVEWKVVDVILKCIGYLQKFTNLIMRSISIVLYQILINGQPSKRFTLERGWR